MSYNGKVYRKQGGNELVVASGGLVTVEASGGLTVAGASVDPANTTVANALASVATNKIFNAGSHTTTGGEASGNTLSIAHGLTTPVAWGIQVVDAGNNVVTADADVTLSGANLVVADGSTYNTVSGQIIRWWAFGV